MKYKSIKNDLLKFDKYRKKLDVQYEVFDLFYIIKYDNKILKFKQTTIKNIKYILNNFSSKSNFQRPFKNLCQVTNRNL